ncbi:hypothetical protein DHW03_17320 [Pedobacter yonginense]|uniref:Uncharacterized protein n=1 Tax=Pedobacter yonginense TaxID=651869 RepID=A0A317EKZ5_9SPHI|nr:hypothetical protein DHW03_17320 [Pedobacter yonginense]
MKKFGAAAAVVFRYNGSVSNRPYNGSLLFSSLTDTQKPSILNPMGRKAAIFHSAWRYSGAGVTNEKMNVHFQSFLYVFNCISSF